MSLISASKVVAIGLPTVLAFTGFGARAFAQLAPGSAQLTPQQVQSIMMMRALMPMRHQVHTGIPQDIGLGAPAVPALTDQTAEGAPTTHKSSSAKRAESHASRAEQKRAAREEARAKKAKAKRRHEADE
jgi:hypothetical protein